MSEITQFPSRSARVVLPTVTNGPLTLNTW